MKIFKAKFSRGAAAKAASSYAFLAFASLLIFSASFQVAAAGNFSDSQEDGAKKSISMPSSPSMPSMALPSIGSGFYAPGSSDFYYGLQNQQSQRSWQNSNKAKSDSEKSGSDEDSANSASSGNGSTIAAANSSNTRNAASNATNASRTNTSSNAMNTNALRNLSALKSSGAASSNLLTAGDLSNLSGLGLFGTVSNLLSNSRGLNSSNSKSGANLYQNLAGENFLINQNSSDSKILGQILSELSELKSSNTENGVLRSENKDGFSNTAKTEPKILRFNVNGYDVLSTCKKIYFSEQESDGTFLLTGDRKYFSANKSRSETFYFFFNSKGSDGGITKYKVTPAVSQDSENKYSFLYGLTQKSELEAERTGNLVTLRANDGSGWKMDLLISMN